VPLVPLKRRATRKTFSEKKRGREKSVGKKTTARQPHEGDYSKKNERFEIGKLFPQHDNIDFRTCIKGA